MKNETYLHAATVKRIFVLQIKNNIANNIKRFYFRCGSIRWSLSTVATNPNILRRTRSQKLSTQRNSTVLRTWIHHMNWECIYTYDKMCDTEGVESCDWRNRCVPAIKFSQKHQPKVGISLASSNGMSSSLKLRMPPQQALPMSMRKPVSMVM